MKRYLALVTLILTLDVLASTEQRPGASGAKSTVAPDELQEEEDFTNATQAERDQLRRHREREREYEKQREEDHIRRNQRSGLNNGF